MATSNITPTQFLGRIFEHADAGWLTLFSADPTTGDRLTDWYTHDQYAEMADRALEIGDTSDVWYGMATRERYLSGRRGGDADCSGVGCMWADIDVAGPNHANIAGRLPDDDTARRMLREFPIPASIIVATGGGYHAYWLLDEALDQADSLAMLDRWAATWAAHAERYDASVDNVFDLSRILRVPGTINQKDGSLVSIVYWGEERYSVSDLTEITIEPPPPVDNTRRNVPYTGAERPGDDFNARHTAAVVLEMDGWTLARTYRNGDSDYLHPWSPTSGKSATVYGDDGHACIWSDTVPQHRPAIETRKGYDPFGLYARLMHEGDMRAATIQLAKDGYGAQRLRSVMEGVGGGYVETTDQPMGDGMPSGKPIVYINGRHLDDLADEVVGVLVDANDPPKLFRHGDVVARLNGHELDPVDRNRMVHIVERTMKPVALKKDVAVPARLDAATLDLSMLRLLDEMPIVKAVMRSPFLRGNGTVCASTGYDRSSGNYLAGDVVVDVPDAPTADDVADAVALIDDMIADFPLAGRADRAHVFAMLLTPPIRHLVPLVPLFIMDGNGPGVGKNLLAESCMYVATGEWVQTDPLPLDVEEQRKQITALLSTGRSVALFDEAHIISGTSLARLITSTTWGDRLLGYSKQVAYPNRITVVALGNNVEVQGDMPRRSILVRLESQLARPYDRQDFRHDDLRAWVEEHRPALLGAILTLLVGWHQAGRPVGGARLGSFDAWASMVGGVLAHAGVDGFLSNVGEMRDRGATDDIEMEGHVHEIGAHFMGQSFTAKQVARLIEVDGLDSMPPRLAKDKANHAQSIGHSYRRYSGRWMGGLRLVEVDKSSGVRRWRVETMPAPKIASFDPETAPVGDGVGGLGGLGGLVNPHIEKNHSYIRGAKSAEAPDQVHQVHQVHQADAGVDGTDGDPVAVNATEGDGIGAPDAPAFVLDLFNADHEHLYETTHEQLPEPEPTPTTTPGGAQ